MRSPQDCEPLSGDQDRPYPELEQKILELFCGGLDDSSLGR